jgi:CubicO group peptidase (beta-lactamase class C family)
MKKLVESFVSSKIEQGLFSGCQVLVAHKGETLVKVSEGFMVDHSEEPSEKVTSRTLFNIESITKVMVTLPLTFWLLEKGRLSLENKLVDYLPEFGTDNSKTKVTIRDMLNFTAGIPLEDPPGCEKAAFEKNLEKAWELHYTQELFAQPGSRVFYSDVSCRILGKLLERIMGKDLGTAARELIFEPLNMNDTMFRPPNESRCAATGRSDSDRDLRGSLCQDLEHYMGEVLGSDGIFTTADDMLKFSLMLLNQGVFKGNDVFGKQTIEKMIGAVTNKALYEIPTSYLHYILSGPKVWFWEYANAPYSFFGDLVSNKAIGKMGGAGTFLLIDPALDLTVVYLTNYGQPENTLEGEESWTKFQNEINMPGLCNLVIGNLPRESIRKS